MSFDRGAAELIQQYGNEQGEREAAAEKAQAEAEAQRLQALEAKQESRQLQDAYAKLSTQERSEFDRNTDHRALVERLTEQARQEVDGEYLANNRAVMEREFIQWRTQHPGASFTERHDASKAIKDRAQEREQEWKQARDDLALQSEAIDDPIEKALATLVPKEREIVSRLLKEQLSPMDHIQTVKQATAQREHAELQAELRAQYEAEVKGARGNVVWVARAKYRKLGLEI